MEDWRSLVDLEKLDRWMEQQNLGPGPITDPTPLHGGTQNILLRFRRAGRDYVLRRPPGHLRKNSNSTMRREMRMLGALADTKVAHPRLIAGCPEEDVLGVAFYLMEPVDGFNATNGLPELHASDPAIRERMGYALVDGILALAAVDYRAVGLSDFGKPDHYLERQVKRWQAQLESYEEFRRWPGPAEIPGVEKVGAWLERNRPTSFEPGILHGDYHLANVMYRHDGPELAAIVDWELTTIGDPLIDLGWLMAMWPSSEDRIQPGSGVQPWEGFPTADQLVAHYRAHSHRDLSAAGWYGVLACYKLGIILEGTYARACEGKAPVETGDRLHAKTQALFARALRWID